MKPVGALLLAGLAASSLPLSGCARRAGPDVVVITLDTVRADHLGCYGKPGATTPTIDRLAGRGVLFTDASCAVPLTLPSHASLFTGRYPTATGVRNNGTFVVPDSETTLAERLAARGYATGAVIAAYPLVSRYGLAQGFEIYDESLPHRAKGQGGAFAVHFAERDAREVTDRALDVWARLGGRSRFLWVHYFDAHAPYAAPDPWGSAHADSPYDGEIAYVDAQLARLLARIEHDAPQAVVVLAADHGEGLGEHGEKTHGVFVYQSTVRVPLVIAAPGRWQSGLRVTEPVSLVDVVPTILELVGAEVPPGMDGTNLAPAVSGAPLGRREVYAESYLPLLQFRFSPLAMLRDGPLKYIDAPTAELYDLGSDPSETENLAGETRDVSSLASRLAVVLARADPDAVHRAEGALDADSEARLRSLGYTAAGPWTDTRHRGLRDPKSMTAYLQRYDRAVGLQASGHIDEGLSELSKLVPEAPENYMVRFQLAAGLLAGGRPEEARVQLAQVIAAAPEFGNAHWMLADCLVALGRIDEAVTSFDNAALLLKTQAGPKLAEGRALLARGRFDAAAAAYRAAIAREPRSAEAAEALLSLRASRGDLPRAVSELADLATRSSNSPALQTVLAEAQYRAGDVEGSRATLRRALALDPVFTQAKLLEAAMLLDADQPRESAEVYRALLRAKPGMRVAELGLGRALVLGGSDADAESFVAALAERYPKDSAPSVLQGVLLERRGDRAGALAAYRDALALDPADPDARRGVARITTAR